MKRISKHAVVVVLLWVFAPLAWFLMWQDKRFHSWFPKVLWINGIIFGVIFSSQSVKAIPKLDQLYELLHIQVPSYVHPLGVFLIIFFAIGQIIAGIKLEQKVRVKKHFADKFIALIIIVFAIDGILGIITGFIATTSPAAFMRSLYQIHNTTQSISQPAPTSLATIMPTPTTKPTPTPLSFKEMSSRYGPCVDIPVATYHHIEESALSLKNRRLNLAVTPEMFRKQVTYLSQHGYNFIFPEAISSFFDSNTPLPSKPIMLTFDDGYEDFYYNALPILKEFNAKAVLFLPTGLAGNSGYVNWAQIKELSSSGHVYIGNHTWSHASMAGPYEKNSFEIVTANRELQENGLNQGKVFAYPYGTTSQTSQQVLAELGYSLGFTTQSGRVLCKKNRLTLPRVRIGNAEMSRFGIN